MGKQYDNTNRGALFKNADKQEDKHPDYKGRINVNGVDCWLSAWIKEDREGSKYMSLAATPMQEDQAPKKSSPARKESGYQENDIPF